MPRQRQKPPNRGDGRYEVKITVSHDRHGNPIRKSFYSTISREDAKRQADAYRVSLQASTLSGIPMVADNITFGEWATQWLHTYKEGSVRDNTFDETYRRTVEKYLIPHFGRAQLRSIRHADIVAYLNQQSTKYSDSTLSKMRLCLNAIFKSAMRNHLCNENPAEDVRIASKIPKAKKSTLTVDQRNRVLEFSRTHPYGLYIAILLEAGLRCSELCGLRWQDIDTTAKTLTVAQAATATHNVAHIDDPKSKTSARTIPISTDLCRHLVANRADPPSALIVCTRTGAPYTPANFTKNRYNIFWNDLAAVHPDIPRLSPHELRHTCGTLLYERTRDIYGVSKYLGHANVQITAKLYIHESTDALRANLGIE